jgi:hypothetical protein
MCQPFATEASQSLLRRIRHVRIHLDDGTGETNEWAFLFMAIAKLCSLDSLFVSCESGRTEISIAVALDGLGFCYDGFGDNGSNYLHYALKVKPKVLKLKGFKKSDVLGVLRSRNFGKRVWTSQ